MEHLPGKVVGIRSAGFQPMLLRMGGTEMARMGPVCGWEGGGGGTMRAATELRVARAKQEIKAEKAVSGMSDRLGEVGNRQGRTDESEGERVEDDGRLVRHALLQRLGGRPQLTDPKESRGELRKLADVRGTCMPRTWCRDAVDARLEDYGEAATRRCCGGGRDWPVVALSTRHCLLKDHAAGPS